jgi:hypothetical protein
MLREAVAELLRAEGVPAAEMDATVVEVQRLVSGG